MGTLKKILQLGGLVKFSHTIFALPFALASMLMAAKGLPDRRIFFWILLAMITARNMAMAFNRYIDADSDAKNPRTASRHIPQGLLSRNFVLGFSVINALLFILIASQINPLCFWLSFPAVFLLGFYSTSKRFTSLSHLLLGLTLGLAPIGSWIAVQGSLSLLPIFLGLAVLFWVAGFDIIYAAQDHDFDQSAGLHSLVVRLGIARALTASRVFHLMTVLLLLVVGRLAGFSGIYLLTVALIAALFFYEHSLVSPKDLSRVNAAFFNVNGFISLLFLAGVTLSL